MVAVVGPQVAPGPRRGRRLVTGGAAAGARRTRGARRDAEERRRARHEGVGRGATLPVIVFVVVDVVVT